MIFDKRSRAGWLVLFLAITFLAAVLPVSGQAETLRFVFLADCRGQDTLINTAALQEINQKILALSPEPAFVLFGGDLVLVGVNVGDSNNFQAFK